jgi:hypothetical protein
MSTPEPEKDAPTQYQIDTARFIVSRMLQYEEAAWEPVTALIVEHDKHQLAARDAEIAELKRQLDEAQKDSKRLDWLFKMDADLTFEHAYGGGPSKWSVWVPSGNRNDMIYSIYTGESPSAAIDVAMQPDKRTREGTT